VPELSKEIACLLQLLLVRSSPASARSSKLQNVDSHRFECSSSFIIVELHAIFRKFRAAKANSKPRWCRYALPVSARKKNKPDSNHHSLQIQKRLCIYVHRYSGLPVSLRTAKLSCTPTKKAGQLKLLPPCDNIQPTVIGLQRHNGSH